MMTRQTLTLEIAPRLVPLAAMLALVATADCFAGLEVRGVVDHVRLRERVSLYAARIGLN
jgi:hypothetical protein